MKSLRSGELGEEMLSVGSRTLRGDHFEARFGLVFD